MVDRDVRTLPDLRRPGKEDLGDRRWAAGQDRRPLDRANLTGLVLGGGGGGRPDYLGGGGGGRLSRLYRSQILQLNMR